MTTEQQVRLELLRMALANGNIEPEAFVKQWQDWIVSGQARAVEGAILGDPPPVPGA